MAKIVPFAGIRPRPELPLQTLLTEAAPQSIGCGDSPHVGLPEFPPESLIRDTTPVYYAYKVDYRTDGGIQKTRLGLVGRIDPFPTDRREVLPAVDAAPHLVDSTVEHLTTTRLKTGCVVAGYEDAQFEVERILVRSMTRSPLVVNLPGQRHTVWPVTTRRAVDRLSRFFRDKECILFEGTHHVRAARRIRDVAHTERWDVTDEDLYPMVHLLNVYDFAVSLASDHYLIPRADHFDLNQFVLKTSTFFDVQNYPWGAGRTRDHALGEFDENLRIYATNRVTIGAYFPGEPQLFLFVLKENVDRVSVLPPEVSSSFYTFSVIYLRRLFLERYYWESDERTAPWNQVVTAQTLPEALRYADETDSCGAAFFLAPPTKRSLGNLARKGKRLPPGSARLHPPAIYGLIMDPLSPCFSTADLR